MKLLLKPASWRYLAIASLLFFIYSENFAQFVEKDLVTGLTTRGNGLSCAEVYLSDEEKFIERNLFIYGETFYVNFAGMEGFNRMGKSAFPEMQLLIVSEHGDTALHVNDLYARYEEGIEFSPLDLNTEVTVANPVHSGVNYTLFVNIRDKRGNGTLSSTLEFTVVRDERIKISGNKLTSREIYLFSQQGGHTITNGQAEFNENIYLLFEGLEGFSMVDGQVLLGLSIAVKDVDGNVILDEADLFGDAVLSYDDAQTQLSPNFILRGTYVANPVSFKVRIWDKKSSAWISASTELFVE